VIPCRFIALSLLLFSTVLCAGESEPVSFRREIAPVLQRRCANCHNEENAKGDYRLDMFARLLESGDSDLPVVVAGKAEESEFFRLLIEPNPEDRMPQKADALPSEEIALIKRWIDEGAAYDGGEHTRPLVELIRELWLRPAPEHYARPSPITALAFSPDGSQIAASGYHEVTLWNAETGELARRIGSLPERITSLAWHPKRNLIAVAGGAPSQWGAVFLIDPAAGFQVRVLIDLPETALSVAFSPDGKWLLAGCADRTTRLFELPSGKQTRLWRQHADWVQSVAFNRDGTLFVTASRDRTARTFDVASGEMRAMYDDHAEPLLTAAFSGNMLVVSAARNQALRTWDATDAKHKSVLDETGRTVQTLLPFNSLVVTGGTDRLLRITQLSDRRTLFTLFGHRDAIESLALAPGNQIFASGAHDGEILIWNLACGTWLRRFTASP
jgi:WD40 repeat protein